MGLLRFFNALSTRKKLMILHNIFFLLLAAALWIVLNSSLNELAESAGRGGGEGDWALSVGELVRHIKIKVAFALILIYGLAVLALEVLILPHYVYRPIKRWLAADSASQRGDRGNEIIPEDLVFPDEIGQITKSRNLTVRMLRDRQSELQQALELLEAAAADLKKKNHLLETAKQNLADQDRLVSLGMLSAGVAHELNSPLAVLHGSIEKMMEVTDEPRLGERLERMLRVTQRLRSISESLLDFARARKQSLASVGIHPLIEEAWSLVRIDRKAGPVRFINRVPVDTVVLGNAARLLQVFVNLLRNSIDAIDREGTVHVFSNTETRDGKGWTAITVADDGAGIDANILSKVFEPFVTSRLDARGTGLGLAVAEGIVHQHGGVIIGRNQKSGGAAFEVTLPQPTAAPPSEGATG